MKKILIKSMSKTVISLGGKIFKSIKEATNIEVTTNAKTVLKKIKNAVADFKSATKKDYKGFKKSIKNDCKKFKDNMTQNCKDFKENVCDIVDEAEADVSINNKKILKFRNKKLSVDIDAINECAMEVANLAVNICINAILDKLSNMSKSYANAAA